MREEVVAIYPWPDRRLSPNGNKSGWRKKHSATKAARTDAYHITMREHKKLARMNDKPELWIEFYPPDNRRRDVQNTIASCKAMIDGIADALRHDDSELTIYWPPRYADVKRDEGMIIVRFRPAAEGRAA
jgi:hypothetical protein